MKVVPDDQDIQVKADRSLDYSKAKPVVSTYDLNALEAGVKLAAAQGGTVTAIAAGPASINDSKQIKNILARGCDDLAMVADDACAGMDARQTAAVLAGLAKNAGADLVLCGDGSADMYAQQVDVQLACALGWPVVNAAAKIEIADGAATVTRIEEDETFVSADEKDKHYIAYVTYIVNGREYTEALDSYSPSYEVGKEVKVKYDPAAPATVRDASMGFSLYLMCIGAALIAVAVVTMMKNRQQRRDVKETRTRETGGEPQPLFRPSHKLPEEREVYFLTDQGTAKGTCHIEDGERNLLYEAVCDKFSLLGDSLYTFADREHGTEKQYSVGKTLTQSSDGLFALDNHSSFPLNGKDVWKQLHKNGIRIETGLDGLEWPTPSIGTRRRSPGSSAPAGRSTRRTKAASSPRCPPPGSSASGPGKSIWTPSF